MKVLWVSPEDAGVEVAQRVREAGHQVVAYGAANSLPNIRTEDLATFATAADLVVVDGPFPPVRTRSSWAPHKTSLFFEELRRKHDVVALGPTPTIDLLVGDRRYLRKWSKQLGIPFGSPPGEPWSSGAWFKAKKIVPPGPYLASWAPLFRAINFRGWFELIGTLTPDGPVVSRCSARWSPDAIPEGREAEFLLSMAS